MVELRAKSLRIALLAGAISALGTARVAHANTNLCMPPPATVPGLSGARRSWHSASHSGESVVAR